MFSNDRNIESIGQLIELLIEYIGLQKEYLKLSVTDKTVRVLKAIITVIAVVALLMTILTFLSFAAAFALASMVGTALGFCIVAALYFLFFIIFLCKRKSWIERPLVRFMASLLLKQ